MDKIEMASFMFLAQACDFAGLLKLVTFSFVSTNVGDVDYLNSQVWECLSLSSV